MGSYIFNLYIYNVDLKKNQTHIFIEIFKNVNFKNLSY